MNLFGRKTFERQPTTMPVGDIQGALTAVSERIDACQADIDTLIRSRGHGEDYTVEMDSLGAKMQNLLATRQELLHLADHAVRQLGRQAVDDDRIHQR